MGKPYRIPGASDRLRKQQKQIKDLQAINRIRNTPRPVAATAFSGFSAAGDNGSTGNFLSNKGDTMIGPLALAPPVDFSVDIDGSNTIDIGESSSQSQYSSNIQIEDVPTSTTLDIIAGAAFDGQILVIRTFAPPIGGITISQATLANGGNIQTPDDTDVTGIGDLQMIVLIFDAALIVFDNAPGGTWRLLNTFGTGGGGGLSEPVILTVNEITPETLPTTSVVDWSKNPNHITLDRAIEFSFANLPASPKYEGVLVIIDIDGVGGFESPIWPASLTNPPIVPTTPNTRTSVMLYTIDGGTTVTHATSVGSSTGGGGTLSDLIIDVTKDWQTFGITNLSAIQYVDTGATPRGTISGDSGAAAIRLATASGGKFIISDIITDIVSFDDTTGITIEGSHVINMSQNTINTIGKLEFAGSSSVVPNSISIDFNAVSNALVYNVPLTTNVHEFKANAELLAAFSRIGVNSGQLSVDATVSNILQANEILFLSTFTNATPVNGDVWRDSTSGLFQFRQNGATVGLAGGGGPTNQISQGNSSVTVTDVGSGLVTFVLDGVQIASMQNNRMDFEETNIFGIEQINMNDSTATQIMSLTANTTSLDLDILTATDTFDISFNGVDLVRFNNANTQFLSGTPNTLSAAIRLFRNDPSPVANDALGSVNFDGNDSLGNFTNYGRWIGAIESPTNGAEIGRATLTLLDDGLDTIALQMSQGALTVNKFSATPAEFVELNLEKEDATPSTGDNVARLNMSINDNGVIVTYARMQAIIQENTDASLFKLQLRSNNTLQDALNIEGNDNNTQFQYLMSSNGNTRIQPLSPTRMGYFVTPQVTDFLLNLGTSGSLEIPSINDGSPSVNDLNQAFGAFDGAFGVDTDIAGNNERLYVRISATEWLFFNAGGSIT